MKTNHILILLSAVMCFSSCDNKKTQLYTVTWKNYDGTILEVDTDVKKWTSPSYDSVEPSRLADSNGSYEFKGWDKDLEAVTHNVEYIAQFNLITIPKFVITWDVDGDKKTEEYEKGQVPNYSFGVPEKQGDKFSEYVFDCWNPEITPVIENVTYVAQFTKFNIYWFYYSTGRAETVKLSEDNDILGNMPKNLDPKYTATTKITYYWELISEYEFTEKTTQHTLYQINYHLDGGTNSFFNPNVIAEDEKYVLSPALKKGYDFVAWYFDSGLTQPVQTLENIDSDIDLYATYIPTNYSISYHLDGGENSSQNPGTITMFESFGLFAPVKYGYTFNGWFTKSNFATLSEITTLENVSGNIDLYAKFTPNTYLLQFNSNGGKFAKNTTKITFIYNCQNIGNKTVILNEGETLPYEYPERTGYIFLGWYLDSGLTEYFDFNYYMQYLYEDIILYAKWTKNDVQAESMADYYDTHTFKIDEYSFETFFFYIDDASTLSYLNYSTKNSIVVKNLRTQKEITLQQPVANDYGSAQETFRYFEILNGDVISLRHDKWGSGPHKDTKIWFKTNQTNSRAKMVMPEVMERSVVFDHKLDIPSLSPRDHYTFEGWFTLDNNKISDGYWNLDYSGEIKAVWKPDSYHINYHLESVKNYTFTNPNPEHFLADQNFEILPLVFSDPNITFVSWKLEDGTDIANTNGIYNDIDLYSNILV